MGGTTTNSHCPRLAQPLNPAWPSWSSALRASLLLAWARRAPLMLMMRPPAMRIMRSRPRAEAASSNLLALHRVVQKPAQRHTERARAFRSHSPADFEFPRPCRRPHRGAHHEHQRDPRGAAKEGRRLVPASLLKGFAFTQGRGHRRGTLRCPIALAFPGWRQCRRPASSHVCPGFLAVLCAHG